MKERLLDLFQKKKSMTLKEIEKSLKLKSSKDFVELIKTLNQMEEDHMVYTDHNKYYCIDSNTDFICKVKDVSKYEFITYINDQKIRIRKDKSLKVFDQDEVLVHMTKHGPIIQRVMNHTIKDITGTFYARKKDLVFHSDIDFHRDILITNRKEYKIHSCDKAVVQIVDYSNPLKAKIIEILGNENDKGVDITARLYKNHVRQTFSNKVLKEVKKLPLEVVELDFEGRVDLRDLLTVTIDGDDAKDFDDAISVEKNKSGYILYVHIADVSHYVKKGSAIDQEAYLRATSIYVCDRVVPMLPFELSNGICSLNPNVDRCTLTCKMYIDDIGNCFAYEIFPSIIHSNMRCTYDKVDQYLNGGSSEYDCVGNLLKDFEALAKLLNARSMDRGNIEFNTKEALITLNKKGRPVSISCKERGFSAQMIEEAMILANVCVAKYLNQHQLPCMYRIHEKPDPKKVYSLMSVCSALNVPVDFDVENLSAKDIQQLLLRVDDEYTKEVLSMVSLRTMQKARYDEKCLGHFGLALDEYCHFTSPIRRYPDLIVHRMLRKYVFEESKDSTKKDIEKIKEQSLHVSMQEREAINVEREIEDFKKAEFMYKHIGETFIGTIVGVMDFGFFVELENTIEGLVPVHTLYYDYFHYDEDRQALIGESSDEIFTLGQRVKVLCTQVDIEKGQVTFALK